MASIRARMARYLVVERGMRRALDLEHRTVEQMRAVPPPRIPLPRGTKLEALSVAGRSAERVLPLGSDPECGSTLLYFHGGGFFMGSCASHRDLAARIAKEARTPALLVEYRLAPEHAYPAANEDCLAAYRWLLEQGVRPGRIIIGGDSAGANLALMTLLALRDAREPLPAAAFLLCPWDVAAFDAESYSSRARLDPLNDRKSFQLSARYFFGDGAGNAEKLALGRQDLRGLPPLLIQVGDHEVILDDARRLAEHARQAGVETTLEVWDGMWHVFQAFASLVPEARSAVRSIGAFARRHLEASEARTGDC